MATGEGCVRICDIIPNHPLHLTEQMNIASGIQKNKKGDSMKLLRIVLIIGVMVIATSVFADDVIKTVEYGFTAKYPDGYQEMWIARYEAFVKDHRYQTGHASKPPKYIKDTRRGHQDLETYINRKLSLYARSGRKFDDGSFTKVYYVGSAASGGWDDSPLSKIIGKHKPLTDCHPEFDGNRRTATIFLEQKFEDVVTADLEKIKSEIRQKEPNITFSEATRK